MHTRNMDQLDVAINLRKLEFPACVQKVLPIIGKHTILIININVSYEFFNNQ